MVYKCADGKNNNVRRVLAAILAVVLVFVVLFSTIYIVKEHHHECHGAECPICHNILRCVQFLNQISTGLIHLSISVATVMIISVILPRGDENFSRPTLVSNKVRLDN